MSQSMLSRPGIFPVVGIGASAGGIEALCRLLDVLPPDTGMTFIVVQHLSPYHPSHLPDLLTAHTSMPVVTAAEGQSIEPDRVYVIPPGSLLGIGEGHLRLTAIAPYHGSRTIFDYLLDSLSKTYSSRAICIVLSGTGSDGSVGLKAIKEKGGLVIAQTPEEAGHDGMPRHAISTGAVDLVLPIETMPEALASYARSIASAPTDEAQETRDGSPAWLPDVVELIHSRTGHDFTLYKPGTLQRRIHRRMAIEGIDPRESGRFLALLRGSDNEAHRLAKDILINVTSFFRDLHVFEALERTIIPEILQAHPVGEPLRIWVAACSTGEEAYSLAMLFLEALAHRGMNLKLQIFASDTDREAIVKARDGLYPAAIDVTVSHDRLARFFNRQATGYRVSAELRAAVVFSVHNVLTDPPFSRMHLVSCRNLLVYLGPEAQARVLSTFHFGLRENGLLLLGTTETPGDLPTRFSVLSKHNHVYRRVGRSQPGDTLFLRNITGKIGSPADAARPLASARQTALAELCRLEVLDNYAPATILVNADLECLYYLGPTYRYLQVTMGHPTQNLLALAAPALRAKLKSATSRAIEDRAAVVIGNECRADEGGQRWFDIEIKPISSESEDLLLISFIERAAPAQAPQPTAVNGEAAQSAELQRELSATRAELQTALRMIELTTEEMRVANEEAMSINEEYQSTNEELLTSREEQQSLNEELTALNGQLQESLTRQLIMSDDLQNILFSTHIATIFLDTQLCIRFFTPATQAIFHIMPGDIGRPLADLNALVFDPDLLTDAATLLATFSSVEREIETASGTSFLRRIQPYRRQNNAIEGVVITFTDITERKRAANAVDQARQQAETATAAKSRFLAAASHDLRQPLQTLMLIQGLLHQSARGETATQLTARLGETLDAMASMLDVLLDVDQIEVGAVRAATITFPIDVILTRLKKEFAILAQEKPLRFRVIPCSAFVESDPRLLEQMLRNLLSNALKYTHQGKVLLGCRRISGRIRVEVWDTGIGIPQAEQRAIFDEYRQLHNPARERSRGLGLGLSIVRRLSEVLDHPLTVHSTVGRGSGFAIEIPSRNRLDLNPEIGRPGVEPPAAEIVRRTGRILLVEDDPSVRDLLRLALAAAGHEAIMAADGEDALAQLKAGLHAPDLILVDYNLPGAMTGVDLALRIREFYRRAIPGIVLTGDSSSAASRLGLQHDLRWFRKPMEPQQLTRAVKELLEA